MAVGVLAHFNGVKIQVPNQIAVIGFSNWFISQIFTPKLSTVDQPSYEMGVSAFNLLLEEMMANKENLKFKPRTIELATHLIERESTLRI